MKFDLHCHTKEGSLDSRVSVSEFVHKFMTLGYDGFMIADHNSYKGCKAWDSIKGDPRYRDFCVIRGLEYDTKDAGHILVIMPDDLYLPIMRIRGMRCSKLIKIVHACGGILGPAHPFGAAASSAMNFKNMNMRLMKKFDFIEVFNTCESSQSNMRAAILAEDCGLPGFAGSDSHVSEYIGMACTEIGEDIYCNNDLIEAVKNGAYIKASGTERGESKKAKRKEHWIGVLGFRLYNRGIAKIISPYRKLKRRKVIKPLVRPSVLRQRDINIRHYIVRGKAGSRPNAADVISKKHIVRNRISRNKKMSG